MSRSVGSLDGTAKDNFTKLKSALHVENCDNCSVHSDEIERRILDKIEAITKKDINVGTEVDEDQSKNEWINAAVTVKTEEVEQSIDNIKKISTGTSPPPQTISTQVHI